MRGTGGMGMFHSATALQIYIPQRSQATPSSGRSLIGLAERPEKRVP